MQVDHDASGSQPPALVVRGLAVRRGGRTVLDGVSLSVARGAVAGLVGPSGGGKTTLMRAIVGVQVVAGGEIAVLGLPAGTPALRSRVGYVTQAPAVYADLTVRENLRYFARVLDAPAARIDEVLELVDLSPRAAQVVRTLSGGERARTSLAAALLGRPEVLVLDEPTVGLDPLLRRDLWALFRGLAADGATLIVSTHVLDEATHCDQVLLLRDGRLLADAPPGELLARTGTRDLDAAFLALVERGGNEA